MEVIKYWTFEIDNGSSYGYIKGNYSTLSLLQKRLSQSKALKGSIHALLNSHGKYVDNYDDYELKVVVTPDDDKRSAEIKIYLEGTASLRIRVGETKEIKEVGKPYKPAESIYEDQELDLSEYKLITASYLKEFKLDGIPSNYGEVE